MSHRFALTVAVALVVAWGAAVLHPAARADSEMRVRFPGDARQKHLLQMGLVFKMYANESQGERFPAKSAEHGAFYPEVPEIWPEYLNDSELLAHVTGEREVAMCYLGHVVRNEREAQNLLDVYEQEGPEAVCNRDLTIGEGEDATTLYRLREGIERFYITDINDPTSSTRVQSELPILWELADTSRKKGGYVLYLDGHVTWQRYPGDFPMTEALTQRIRAMMSATPGEVTGDGREVSVVMGNGPGDLGMVRGRGDWGARKVGGGFSRGRAGGTGQTPAATDGEVVSLSGYSDPARHRTRADSGIRGRIPAMKHNLAGAALDQQLSAAALEMLALREMLRKAEERAQHLPEGAAVILKARRVKSLVGGIHDCEEYYQAILGEAAECALRARIAPFEEGPKGYLAMDGPGPSAEWVRINAGDEFEGLRVDGIAPDAQVVQLTDLETGKQFSLTTEVPGRIRRGAFSMSRRGGGPDIANEVPVEWVARRRKALEQDALAAAKRLFAEKQAADAWKRAEAGPPQIRVRGFFEDAETGVVRAFLDIEEPAHDRITKVAIQEGDFFQNFFFNEILRDLKGIRVTNLTTGEESTVLAR